MSCYKIIKKRGYVQAIMAIADAVVSSGTAAITGIANKRENERARKEARELAEIQRQDTLTFQNEQNKLTNRQIDNNQNNINFGKSLFGTQVKEQNKQKQFMEDTTNQSVLEQTADQNLDPLKLNRRRFI